MYSLLSRIADGLSPLRDRFENHVRRAGLGAIEKVSVEADTIVRINEK
jgi:cullin 1